jgi:transposase
MLMAPSVDELIPADHVIRELDRIFEGLDWQRFEAEYDGARGQPAIHPKRVAAGIFYGLLCGLRSSRKLEEGTRLRLDFIWLLEGQTIDHTTFAKFRTRFGEALKAVFRQVNAEALQRTGEAVLELVVDGTRMRANSDRHGARTAEWLERRQAQLQAYLEQGLEELAVRDLQDDPPAASVEHLQHHMATLAQELERCERALAVARERDAAKQAKEGASAHAVRVPVTDPDAYLLPNKEGGYAPNYTPVAGVDSRSGMILAAEVLADGSESAALQPLVQAVETDQGTKPERVLCDSGFASGSNQAALAAQGIAVFAPVEACAPEQHPARRDDPAQPLSPERIRDLPRVKRSGVFDRNAFLYDARTDAYYCPLGRCLRPRRTSTHTTADGTFRRTEYACPSGAGCPLAAECLSRQAKYRTVGRDEFEAVREATARRMQSAEGRAIYRRRAPLIEGTFANTKSIMGLRTFLLRGLQKVRTEWLWICTAFNLGKLLRLRAANRRPGTPPPPPCQGLPTRERTLAPVIVRCHHWFRSILRRITDPSPECLSRLPQVT